MSSSIIERINAVTWREFSQPAWNHERSVADALIKVVDGDSDAYYWLMSAVGNNPAGYFPVLTAVVPFLAEMVECGTPSAQRIALCLLDDFVTSFHLESRPPGRQDQDAGMEFWRQFYLVRPKVEHVSSAGGENAKLAAELLWSMDQARHLTPD